MGVAAKRAVISGVKFSYTAKWSSGDTDMQSSLDQEAKSRRYQHGILTCSVLSTRRRSSDVISTMLVEHEDRDIGQAR